MTERRLAYVCVFGANNSVLSIGDEYALPYTVDNRHKPETVHKRQENCADSDYIYLFQSQFKLPGEQ